MKSDVNSEFARVMAGRQVMYQFLARVFRAEIDRELLDEVIQLDFSANSGVQEIDTGFQMLGCFVQELDGTTLNDLATDYARIFLGAGPRPAGSAFPYESVYTSPQGLLMQEARDQVVEFYRQEGIHCSADCHDLEDHIAQELEFVAYLCEKTGQAMEERDDDAIAHYLHKQQGFIDSHLGTWAPRLCTDVARIAATDFYKAIALITSGYLVIDRKLIAGLLEMHTLQAS